MTPPDTDTPAVVLKPCPFCGGTNTDPEGWMATDINGGVSRGPTCDDCDAAAASVAAWNRRASPAPDVEGMRERVLDAAAQYLRAQYGGSHGLDHPVDRARILALTKEPHAPSG